jgi:hypothetical protein
MLINNIINNRVNAYFPKVEASTNQVETQKRARISQTSNQQESRNEQAKMGKDKKKEAERQRRIQLNKKKEMEKLKAFWDYAEKNNQAFLNKFLVEYTGEKSAQINQETQNQEAPAQQQSLDFLDDADLDFLGEPLSPLFDDSNSPLLNYLNEYFK